MRKLALVLSLILAFSLAVTGCTASANNDLGEYIITAEEALAAVDSGAILIDAQNKTEAYEEQHVSGAISITRGMITTYEPVLNSVADKATIETVMMNAGISNDSEVIIYDNNKTMDAGRLFWTMLSYGHENMKVVSGGLPAMIEAGAAVGTEIPEVTPSTYQATELNSQYMATIDDVISQLNTPDANTCIVDVRSIEEFEAGTIPTSVLIPFEDNLFPDGTFKPMQQINILYGKAGIDKDGTVYVYCKTSVRASQTFLALYNAGYTNVKVYDGAYLEWSSDKALPIQMPDGTPVISNAQDAS
jgi:thiosulfate/3-mercaptopyruvate sulfurtransferase